MLLRWSIHFPPPPFSVREIWALQIVVFMCFSVFHVHVHVLAHSGYGIFVIVIMDTEWFTHSLQPPLSQFWDEWLRVQFVSKLNDPEEYWTYKLSLLWCTDQQAVQQRTMPCSRLHLKIGLLDVEGTCVHQ